MSTELRAVCFYSSPLLRWEISAGQLFELMLPASFTLTVLLSAWVMASARRRGLGTAAVTLWTLGALFFPLIILPLYLIARLYGRGREKEGVRGSGDEEGVDGPPLRRVLPLGYLAVMLSLGALYFYMDSRSVDAHLMRANQARVRGQRERMIGEYRAALRLEEDAHVHNLLGKELQAARRFDEALAEFRAAERMGEADEELPFNIAVSLDGLERPDEALPEYRRFLSGPPCVEMPHDVRCVGASLRLAEMTGGEPRP